jgi:histidinol phosphatase-like enzyme (inositol monophosphatase family)
VNKDIEARLAFAHILADASGAVIRPYFRRRIDIEDKGSGAFDPVTEADRRAEEIIRERIEKEFPDDAILGEEFGGKEGKSGYRWLLDPIDGTRAFIAGITLWGTLIALEHAGRPVFGVLDQPVLKERFVGAGGKATLTTPETTAALRSRECANLADAIVMTTHPFAYFTPEEAARFDRVARASRLSRFHGDCYAYGLLAMGFVDCVAEAGLKEWDTAALIPIVEGAGGIITDWNGLPVRGGGRVLACGDPRVHAEAVRILSLS